MSWFVCDSLYGYCCYSSQGDKMGPWEAGQIGIRSKSALTRAPDYSALRLLDLSHGGWSQHWGWRQACGLRCEAGGAFGSGPAEARRPWERLGWLTGACACSSPAQRAGLLIRLPFSEHLVCARPPPTCWASSSEGTR